MLPALLVAASLAVAPDAVAPLEVPLGGSGWNTFQVLGLTRSTAAVREVTLADADDDDDGAALCSNPGMAAVLRGRVGTESLDLGDPTGAEGVTLHAWRLPPPGGAVLPSGDRELVYRSGPLDAGCTGEPEAKAALQRIKGVFADAGVDLARAPAHVDLFTGLVEERDFTGRCFVAGKARGGCTLTRAAPLAGAPVELSLNLQAHSDCELEAGEAPGLGCQVERRYRGTVKHRGAVARFDLLLKPRGDNAQHALVSVAAVASGDATVLLLYTSWCYVSCRERVPVLVRVR